MDININITNTQIETHRLILRPWNKNDLEDFFEYASVKCVGEMAGWPPHLCLDDTKKVLDSFIAQKNEYAIVYKENNKVIGSIGLHYSWANGSEAYKNLYLKEIGYALSANYWGNGLMPEASRAVIKFCFDNYNLDAITARHSASNNQSRRVIEKCGFSITNSINQFNYEYILFR